jgi:OmpA-OmpF porin, OOP family
VAAAPHFGPCGGRLGTRAEPDQSGDGSRRHLVFTLSLTQELLMTRKPAPLRTALVALGFAALALPAAQAQGYIGGGIGPARIDVDCTGATTCDKTSTGGKLYGGWLFTPQFAAELGYFNWGKVEATGTFDVDGTPITGSADVKGTGWGVGVAYIAPFTPQWSGVVRVGVARNKGKTSVSALGASASESFNSTQPYVGIGVGYELMPNLTLTGEADFSRVKYTSSDKADAYLVSVGLRWKF